MPGAPGAQRPEKRKLATPHPLRVAEDPSPSTRIPRAPSGKEDPGRVWRSPGSRAGAARKQGGRRGPGGPRRSGVPWLQPGGRTRAAGVVAAAASAARAPRRAFAWRGRPDTGRNRSPGAGTGPRPRRHLPARPRPGRPLRAGPPAAAVAGPAATAAPAVAAPAAPAERRLLPASQSPFPPSPLLLAQPASRPLPPAARLPPFGAAGAHAGRDQPWSRLLAAAPHPGGSAPGTPPLSLSFLSSPAPFTRSSFSRSSPLLPFLFPFLPSSLSHLSPPNPIFFITFSSSRVPSHFIPPSRIFPIPPTPFAGRAAQFPPVQWVLFGCFFGEGAIPAGRGASVPPGVAPRSGPALSP